ncbi:MAG: metal ABC transporter substrate-binding protein [Acidobacteriota bacterium]
MEFSMRWPFRILLVLTVLGLPRPGGAALKVVATLTGYASIARAIGGDRVEARSISRPDEDAHFVKPKPSRALMLKGADLFITTGLDLELWGPVLVDKSGNRKIRDGEVGYVSASRHVHMLDIPANPSRAAGDIHLYGNPHIQTSPINAKIIAGNIAAGLIRVDPAGASVYQENLKTFRHRIDVALYGQDLLDLLGPEVLDPLAEKGTLVSFLREKTYQGQPLLEHLGGWLKQGLPFRGRKIIAYHKNWIYFTTLFGLQIVDYVEAKPGIPPSARHVHDLIREIQEGGIGVLLTAAYFDPSKPQAIARRTGCTVVRVPMDPPGEPMDYIDLVSLWVDKLAAAFRQES